MSLTNIEATKSGKKNIERMEDGAYPARIVKITDLGIQESEYEGVMKQQHKVFIDFEFPTEMIVIGEEEKPRWLGKEYVVSTHEKAAMTALMSAADPKGEVTAKGRNLKGLIGLPVMVTVGTTSGGKAKVAAVGRLMKGLSVPELVNPSVFFDLDGKDVEQFEKFPQWIKDKITSGIDFDDTPFAKALAKGVPFTSKNEDAEMSVDEESPY